MHKGFLKAGHLFQLVPQRFAKEIGLMTGIVGMTGGLGGFYLASSLGYSKQFTGRLRSGLSYFRPARRRRPGRHHLRTRSLAHHLGLPVRRGEGLTMNMISNISRRRLVLVGNGMAGVRALEEILSRAPHQFSITALGSLAQRYVKRHRI
jgi:hypothetical protein